jgi:membrane-associated protein
VWFGNFPIVQKNFSLVTIGIVVVSLIPIAVEYVKQRGQRVRARSRRQG